MKKSLVSSALVFLLSSVASYAQGALDPSGPPDVSMKTLEQIEPRHAIESLPYTIEKGGSYYLARNVALGSTNEHGITVAANDVVLDLNGFVIDGPTDGYGEPLPVSGSAIYQPDGYRNLTVRNGNVVHWTDQNTEGAGMIRLLGANNRIQNISVRFCSRGIETGDGSVVEDCTVRELAENNETFGFKVGAGSIVRDCVATIIYGNPAYGFTSGGNCVFERCTAASNYTDAAHAYGFFLGANSSADHCTALGAENGKTQYGFYVGDHSRASGCTAQASQYGFSLGEWAVAVDCSASDCSDSGFYVYEGGALIERCTAQNNTNGISVAHNNVVRNCIAMGNLYQGIDVRDDANTIEGNVCNNNGSSGIYVALDGNRIEGNHLTANQYGLYLRYWDPTSHAKWNHVVKNTAYGNTFQNYWTCVGNSVAPIEPIGTFSNAWANFEL